MNKNFDPLAEQVKSSFSSSLKNLHTDYIDSYLLHGPASMEQMTDDDWEVWEALEGLYKSDKTKMIGVSNVALTHLKDLMKKARIKPMVVQNRCHASKGWDREIREFCKENKIIYQGFSLLTANKEIIAHPKLGEIAKRLNKTPEQIIFAFSKQIGILPITGTTQEKHMNEDLEISNFVLSKGDISLIENINKS